jgi:replicative DNA helicase
VSNRPVFDRVPPQNIEAERAVLGACLLNPDVIASAVEILGDKPSAVFYVEAHQFLYARSLSLTKKGIPVDTVSLMEQMNSARTLERAGGVSTSRGDEQRGPDLGQRRALREDRPKDSATFRRMIAACTRIQSACYNPQEPVEDVLGTAQALFEGLEKNTATSSACHVADVVERVLEETDRSLKGETSPGIKTGIKFLDALTNGLQYNELSFILGRPKSGKTAFALNIAYHAASHGVPVYIQSIEMPMVGLVKRLLTIESSVDFGKISRQFDVEAELERLKCGAIKVAGLPIIIDENPAVYGPDIRNGIRRFTNKYGPGLVIVDYLQKVALPKRADRRIETEDVTWLMAQTAKQTGCHVCMPSQLSRAAETMATGYQMGGAGKESGSIEQDAHLIMVLSKPKAKELDSLASTHGGQRNSYDSCFNLTVSHHRNGPTGDSYVRYIGQRQRFFDLDTNVSEPPPSDPNEDLEDMPF